MIQVIIIRGNSGSGKSSLAKLVREKIGGKVALLEQDYFRRNILKEKDHHSNTDIIDFLLQSTHFAIEREYTVIIEGILYSQKYGVMLQNLINEFDCLAFYMDVSFDETLKRHQTKPNNHEFGYQEMKEWYLPKDYLGATNEFVIPEKFSLDKAVELVVGEYQSASLNR